MKIRIAVVALAIGFCASPAAAQSRWFGESYAVPRHEVIAAVRSAGLRPVSRPVRLRHSYIVHARDRHGDLKRVVVDAEFGDIVRVTAISRPSVPPDHARRLDRRDFDDERPRRGWRDGDDFGPRARAPDDLDPPAWRRDDPIIRPRASIPPPLAREPEARPRFEEEPAPRPRAALPDSAEPGELPPPYPANRNAAEPAPRSKPRTAAVNPTQSIPLPRARPATAATPPTAAPAKPAEPAEPETTAAIPAAPQPDQDKKQPEAKQPDKKPAETAAAPSSAQPEKKPPAAPAARPAPEAAPRVILPGGPPPKNGRSAEAVPNRAPETSNPEAAKPATSPGKPDPAMPPAQGLE